MEKERSLVHGGVRVEERSEASDCRSHPSAVSTKQAWEPTGR